MKRHLSFHSIVRKNELSAINGRWNRTIAYLSGILVLSFLCLGFSMKAYDYQMRLAANPFSTLVTIDLSFKKIDSSVNMCKNLSEPSLADQFFISKIHLARQWSVFTYDANGALIKNTGLTIDPNSSLMTALLDSANTVATIARDTGFKKNPFGWIVTEAFLQKQGFHRNSEKFILFAMTSHKTIPVQILRVVKDLPNRADILCTDSFYVMKSFVYPTDSVFTRYFFETLHPGDLTDIRRVLQKEFNVIPDSVLLVRRDGIAVLSFNKNKPGAENLYPDLILAKGNYPVLRQVHFGPYCYTRCDTARTWLEDIRESRKQTAYTHIFVAFKRLDRINRFRDFIRNRYGIMIDMETIKQRELFLYSMNVALGAIILVLLISGLSILLFLSNTLKTHLEKVKRNLGNFLAFGADRHTIIGIYTLVILKILSVSILIAAIISSVAGEIFEKQVLRKLFILEPDQDYFSLVNWWFILFVLAIILTAVGKTCITVWRLVQKSPGDLIYERHKRKTTH